MKPLALTPAEPLASLMDPAQVAVNALASSSRHFNNPHQQSSQKSVSRPRMCQSGRLEGCGTPQTAFAAPQRPSVPALGGGVPALEGGVPALGGGVPALEGGVPALEGGVPALEGGVPLVFK
ncbi:MAG: hypothetical protein LW645_11000 [Verrucomicrobiaceae bacterium]|nr:hypothetical protein [Verrucomicrobiaceae bacterium]